MTAFTPQQTLIMWHVLGKGGEALQMEIRPAINANDRKVLENAGLITSGPFKSPKGGRPLKITVTDKGWLWANDHLGDELPLNYKILQNWLTQLQAHLARSGERLGADFFAAAKQEQPAASNGAEPRKPDAPVRKQPLSPAQLRERIENAYLAVTNGKKAESALLSEVRARLTDLDRETVDAGLLRILQGDKKASLHQISDPKALSREDREAAFSPGGEPYHLLWIQQ